MKKIRCSIVLGCLILVLGSLVALADANKAVSQAREAAKYAAEAYEYAQKANYNSSGKVKHYCMQAMDAAKKAESAAKSVLAELELSETKTEKK